MSLCMNSNTHGADDMEVISNLIKIRLKPKVLLNHYMLCVRSAEPLTMRHNTKVTLGLKRTGGFSLIFQRTAERSQGQSGHDGEAGDF